MKVKMIENPDGDQYLHFVCGECGGRLGVKSVHPGGITEIVFNCEKCGDITRKLAPGG